jgi:hypothetical protein
VTFFLQKTERPKLGCAIFAILYLPNFT